MTEASGVPSRVSRPVIILGAPRSGTSLLTEILDAHPDVVTLREPRLVWRYGNDRRSDQLRPAHARPEVVDHIHASFGALLRDEDGTLDKRIVEKTPANTVRPLFVEAVFPDARYLHITRNGWAAVPSIRDFSMRRASGLDARQVRKLKRRLKEAELSQVVHYLPELGRRLSGRLSRRPALYGPRLAGLGTVVGELGQLEAAALQWRTCVDSATAFGRDLPAERYLEIQLESLDEDTMARIMEFAGVRVAGAVLERFRSLYRSEAGLRRTALSDDERAVIAPYVLAANDWLGYGEGALVGAGSPAALPASSPGGPEPTSVVPTST